MSFSSIIGPTVSNDGNPQLKPPHVIINVPTASGIGAGAGKGAAISAGFAGVNAGRVLTVVKDGLYSCSIKIKDASLRLVRIFAKFIDDTQALSGLFKKVATRFLPLVEYARGLPDHYRKFKDVLNNTRDCIDLWSLASDIDYWVNNRFKDDPTLQRCGRGMILTTNVLAITCWLGEIGALQLGKAAEAIGNVRLFSFIPKVVSSVPVLRNMPKLISAANAIGNLRVFSLVTKISLGYAAHRALAIAYAFFAANAYQRLQNPGLSDIQKTDARWELAHSASEVALDAMVVVGVTSTVALGLVGTACMALLIKKFIFRMDNSKEINKAIPVKV